jgi:hypothetical protein
MIFIPRAILSHSPFLVPKMLRLSPGQAKYQL